jgi:hypothetical protein
VVQMRDVALRQFHRAELYLCLMRHKISDRLGGALRCRLIVEFIESGNAVRPAVRLSDWLGLLVTLCTGDKKQGKSANAKHKSG